MPRTPVRSDAFRAIADKNRRALLDVLRDGELAVGALVDATGMSYSLVSQHLAVLTEAGVVERRADGRQRIYRIDARPIRAVHDWTGEYERFWTRSLARLRRQLAER
jgi:DNA-binding transcriptional ArsR family regulator